MSAAKKKLIVLNDDPDLVQAMEVVLVESGYAVVTSVHRHLEEVVNVDADLVMIDVPPSEEKQGLNFVQRLRLDKRTAHLPVLLGTTSLRYVEPAVLRDRLIHVLLRPFDVPDLIKAVEELLKSAALSRNVTDSPKP